MTRWFEPPPERQCVAVTRDGKRCRLFQVKGHRRCISHLHPSQKTHLTRIPVAQRKRANALLVNLGMHELKASQTYRMSSARNKLAIAQAAEQAHVEQNPIILQEALGAAKLKLHWIV